jgi:hypothetical protein
MYERMAPVRYERERASQQIARSLKAWRTENARQQAAYRVDIPQEGGAGLPGGVKAKMEGQLGADLSGVKIHTGADSAKAAEGLAARAFTVGQDVHFGGGEFKPGTKEGDRLIAHELTHTVQAQRSGINRKAEGEESEEIGADVSSPHDPAEKEADHVADAATARLHGGGAQDKAPAIAAPAAQVSRQVIYRFGSTEHRDLGDAASGGQKLGSKLDDGSQITFGEMVALAGDYFESYDQIKALLATPEGQLECRWARWKALGGGAEPEATPDIKKRVNDRYMALAAKNISHFGAGGTAKDAYGEGHTVALRDAFVAGATGNAQLYDEAKGREAFCEHFLSDRFSAGHVRTPRAEIKEWYKSKFPDSVDKFVSYTASWIARDMDAKGDVPWYWPDSKVAGKLVGKIRDVGGPAVENFSLGDIISLAYHDHDNQGLKVVSDVGPDGQPVAGGYKWQAKGDDHLAESPDTQKMATAAMKCSIGELDQAHAAGSKNGVPAGGAQALSGAAQKWIGALPGFAAEKFVPREDKAADNVQMNWRWGNLDPVLRQAVDDGVKQKIVSVLREKAGGVAVEMKYDRFGKEDKSGAVVLHPQRSFLAFCDFLAGRGIMAIEEAMEAPAVQPLEIIDGGAPPGGVPEPGVQQPAGTGDDSE